VRRVAVTGIGAVSPLGTGIDATFAAACAGRSAVVRLADDFGGRLPGALAAPVTGFDGAAHFDPPKLRQLDRAGQFALVAMREALARSTLSLDAVDRARLGVFVGIGMGGSTSMDEGYRTLYGDRSDRVKPYTVLTGMHNAPAGWIAIELAATGPSLTYSTACSSSAVAIGEAWLRIAAGQLDTAIAGGTEAPLAFGSLKAWEAMRTLAAVDPRDPSRSCKPFAADRSGMVLGEGAALLVLEAWELASARGATIVGELLGYGLATDALHMTRPSVDGQAAALRSALRSAGLAPEQVDAINAHGTGTPANDGVETAALRAVFGAHAARLPVSATKAVHGHLLGAAGALECALSLEAMRHGVLLPTMHLDAPDPACELDYVPHAARPVRRGQPVRTMLSSSFAFGGTNAVLALRAAP
jgi:3-oxoacyl-(acyl-carrier-protein) synthase